mgnify:CR=1 FL=1|jgi:DNA-directed RNA polymerase I, II, and III subunit RPABC2
MSDNETESINSIGEDTIDLNPSDEFNYNKIISKSNAYTKYYSNNKQTMPFLTKFEKTKMIGIRAQMISEGSTPLVPIPEHVTNSIEIAELEFKQKKIPLFIKRMITQTEYEYWRQEDMINI